MPNAFHAVFVENVIGKLKLRMIMICEFLERHVQTGYPRNISLVVPIARMILGALPWDPGSYGCLGS